MPGRYSVAGRSSCLLAVLQEGIVKTDLDSREPPMLSLGLGLGSGLANPNPNPNPNPDSPHTPPYTPLPYPYPSPYPYPALPARRTPAARSALRVRCLDHEA